MFLKVSLVSEITSFNMFSTYSEKERFLVEVLVLNLKVLARFSFKTIFGRIH